MPKPDPHEHPESAWLGASLIWVAGYVDAIGYITLFHIYAANMSGNSVALAINFAQFHWWPAFAHACPILAFFPGLIAGAVVVKACKTARLRAALLPSMIVEAGFLILFMRSAHHYGFDDLTKPAVYDSAFVLAVGLLSFSMGLQNGALREISGLKNIHTYVTGTLLSTADHITQFLFWLGHRLNHRSRLRFKRIFRTALRRPSLRIAAYSFSLWLLYLIGAVAGALVLVHLEMSAMWVAVIGLLAIGIIDLIAPIAHYPALRSNSSSRSRSES